MRPVLQPMPSKRSSKCGHRAYSGLQEHCRGAEGTVCTRWEDGGRQARRSPSVAGHHTSTQEAAQDGYGAAEAESYRTLVSRSATPRGRPDANSEPRTFGRMRRRARGPAGAALLLASLPLGRAFAPPARLGTSVVPLNVSSVAVCSTAADVCSCAALAPGCGWCSSTSSCAPADQCTLTCRECPSSHKSCRSMCRRNCVETCSAAKSVCSCVELSGCGWCSHGNTCAPYPECSTTCSECDSSCHNYAYCQKSCYRRFHEHVPSVKEGLFPLGKTDYTCASSIWLATVRRPAPRIQRASTA